MGLLSDPDYGSMKWVKILRKVYKPLCILCYIGGLIWFVMLGYYEFNNETYFSENALLPGLVTNDFNAENSANKFYRELMEELQEKYDDSDLMPVPWLVGKMSQLQLEVHTHNYTLNYPVGKTQIYRGTNVYGILRAPRTSSLEAIVVSAPYRAVGSYLKGTTAGIALMLAFAEFARSQKYWAKDIIFLVTDYEQLGMQAWLEAYHGIQSDRETFYTSLGSFWKPSTSVDFKKVTDLLQWGGKHQKCLNPGKLTGRSGSIQAAINLEFDKPKIKYIEVKIEGLNGQLPNLDLVNLVNKLCIKSGLYHSFKNSYSWIRSRDKVEQWMNNLKTMLSMVVTQITGVPNGNHGLFHHFGIEAVTLEGRDEHDPAGRPPRVATLSSANFYRLGVALESIMRSINNLLERFHQSFFFYLLASTNRYISIALYMPSLCLLCAAMLIKALVIGVSIYKEEDKETEIHTPKKSDKRKTSDADVITEQENKDMSNSDDKSNKETSEQKPSEVSQNLRKRKTADVGVLEKHDTKEIKLPKEKKENIELEESEMSVVNIGTNYLLVHLLGYVTMNSPLIFAGLGSKYEMPNQESIFYGLIATAVLLVIITPFLPRLVRSGRMTREELSLVNILLLIELATVCLSAGMINFSLGLAIAVVSTPLALVVGVVTKDKGKGRTLTLLLKRILCILVHPLFVVVGSMTLYSLYLYPEDKLWTTIGRGSDAAMQGIMFAVTDSLIFGNWLFNIFTCVLLPVWIIFWQILCNPVDS